MQKDSYYQHTNYPDIFQYFYWGNYEYEPDREEELLEIFNNRNRFIEEFNIKKNIDKCKRNINYILNIDFNEDLSKFIRDRRGHKTQDIINELKCCFRRMSKYHDHSEVYETNDDKKGQRICLSD